MIEPAQPFFFGFAPLFFELLPDFFVAGSLLAENGGMMSEPLSAEATATEGFGALVEAAELPSDTGSGALDPTRGASVASAPGAFASGVLPPHAAVSAKRSEKPAAARGRVTRCCIRGILPEERSDEVRVRDEKGRRKNRAQRERTKITPLTHFRCGGPGVIHPSSSSPGA